MDLGAPIGQRTASVPSAGFDQGEHGAGVGAAGGHGIANAFNTQSGGLAHGHSHTGTSDAFTGISTGSSTLDTYSKEGVHGSHSHSHATPGQAVSGAYEGGGTRGALTGQSTAETTGAGVGFGGENVRSGALAGGATAGVLGAGAAYGGHEALSEKPIIKDHEKPAGYTGETGTGVGAAGGAGGHYNTETLGQSDRSHGLGESHGSHGHDSNTGSSGAKGHYGTTDNHDRGKPVANPEDLDTGGPHSLVFQESTGKYVHRRDL